MMARPVPSNTSAASKPAASVALFKYKNKATDAAGLEAALVFEGTGLAIIGRCSQEGGRADVYLDGKKAGEIDAWIPERTHDNDYWHVTGLPNGKHVLRLVTRADADARSKGRQLRIDGGVVYGPGLRVMRRSTRNERERSRRS